MRRSHNYAYENDIEVYALYNRTFCEYPLTIYLAVDTIRLR